MSGRGCYPRTVRFAWPLVVAAACVVAAGACAPREAQTAAEEAARVSDESDESDESESDGERGRAGAHPTKMSDKTDPSGGEASGFITRAQPAARPAPIGPTPEEEARARDFTGVFDIDRVAGGKRLQASTLAADDGTRYILSYRPMPEHFDKVEKRVVVRGFTYAPQGQAVMAEHLRALSIRLADDESPYASPPTALPTAPIARSGAELRAREGRWVQAVGVLVGATPTTDRWRAVTLRLDDGATVEVIEAESIVDRIYRPRFGARVTVLGRLFDDDGTLRFGRVLVCDGEVAECGRATPAVPR